MSEVAAIPEVLDRRPNDQWPEPPRLLVEWSSRWEEFKSAFGPALTRAPKALAGEAPIGIFPYRGMLACWLLECLLLIAIIVLPERFQSLQLPPPPARLHWDVIYYSGDELPQTQDRGGAQSGKSGRAGGQQAHHRTQVIRVARGDQPSEKVVDAPKVNLPHSDSAVANLLAFKSNPGPPPAEGLRSTLTAPTLPAMSVVQPSPDLNSALNSKSRTTSNLTTNVVPPSPELNSALNSKTSRTASSMTANVIPPAPEVSHASTRTSPILSTTVVEPAPNVSRDKMQTANPLAQTVVAPAPRDTPRDLASSRLPMTQTVEVVAPPVSAPQRDVSSTPKLSLPTPAVVAPPPSQVSRDLNSWGSSSTGDMQTKPVPPPPTASGRSSLARSGAATLTPQVVPPPASIEGGKSGQGNGRSGQSPSALLGATDVIPPPPGLGGGKALSGSGRGNKGAGAGGPLDLGSAVAPPSNAGGNAAGSGVVVSNQPGKNVGLPDSSGGTIAMSPSGVAKSGLGGSGGGSSIGKGNGPGSGLQGEGSGAGREGAGHGSDPNAPGGISPYPGPGGSGTGTTSAPAIPGVSVQGGTTASITLPSFGAPGGDAPSNGPGRSSTNPHGSPSYTVKATSNSGGVFNRYGQLKGDNYSIYIDTSLGTAAMQYADASSAAHAYSGDLTKPEPIRVDLPQGLRTTYVVFACILDRSGNLKDIKVLEPGAAETTSRILVALHSWKFLPASRGSEPVEVNAFLGFGIDTR